MSFGVFRIGFHLQNLHGVAFGVSTQEQQPLVAVKPPGCGVLHKVVAKVVLSGFNIRNMFIAAILEVRNGFGRIRPTLLWSHWFGRFEFHGSIHGHFGDFLVGGFNIFSPLRSCLTLKYRLRDIENEVFTHRNMFGTFGNRPAVGTSFEIPLLWGQIRDRIEKQLSGGMHLTHQIVAIMLRKGFASRGNLLGWGWHPTGKQSAKDGTGDYRWFHNRQDIVSFYLLQLKCLATIRTSGETFASQ